MADLHHHNGSRRRPRGSRAVRRAVEVTLDDLAVAAARGAAGPALTADEAQAAVAREARALRSSMARLRRVYGALPEPPDYDERLEDRLPWNRETSLRAALEGLMLEHYPEVLQVLERAATETDADLVREHRAWLRRQRQVDGLDRRAGRKL